MREHAADRLERPFGLTFLYETDKGVDDHHAEDDAGVHPMGEGGCDGGGNEQHVDQYIVELIQKTREWAASLRRTNAIGAVFGKPFGRFLERESFLLARQPFECRLCIERVPRCGLFARDCLRTTHA